MRVSLAWLREFVELPTIDVDELTHVFDMLGHAVEGVERHDIGWSDVVIGRVEKIEPHPDADAIRVTHVDIGGDELQQIICGAWNFDEGAVVPVAVPGASLPDGFEIGERAIRGVESRGMICSEKELGLGDDHEGILVLGGDPDLGVPFESLLELPDIVFDLDITTNRPDVMSMLGVARELAAWYELEVREPDFGVLTVPGDPDLTVTIEATDGCNRFVAREIRDVIVGPSPIWVRERLRKAGVRAISNVVDVTNYVMMELGHPLHAFDADRIAGRRLTVRWAHHDERIITLDGVERTLGPGELVIEDDAGPTSMAAVMGGERSEVHDATTTIIMEAASWHPPTVMYTSRRHDLRSEASARFERGVDPNLPPVANARACRLLSEIAGGSVVEGVIDALVAPVEPKVIELRTRDVTRLLGEDFTPERSEALLRRVHLGVERQDDSILVTVPTYRPDLTRPVDLVEEIARLADFDSFGESLPKGPAGGLLPEQRRTRLLRRVLQGLGLRQAINLPFVSDEELALFGEVDEDGNVKDVVTVKNPLRDDQAMLCQSLLPGLLRRVRDNRNRGADWVGLFETDRVFFARPWPDDPRVPDQPARLGAVVTGPFGPRRLGAGTANADASTALAIVSALSDALQVGIERRAAVVPGFHPTRTAELLVDGRVVGVAGELHPNAAAFYEIAGRVGAIEVDLGPLVAARQHHQATPVSTFPHVDFDLSFDVPTDAHVAPLVAATRAASSLVEEAFVFDDYHDLDQSRRSVAIRYRLRATDRTLDSDEIAHERAAMIQAAESLGATLRGSA